MPFWRLLTMQAASWLLTGLPIVDLPPSVSSLVVGQVLVLCYGLGNLPLVWINASIMAAASGAVWLWAPIYGLPEALAVLVTGLCLRTTIFDLRLHSLRNALLYSLLVVSLPSVLCVGGWYLLDQFSGLRLASSPWSFLLLHGSTTLALFTPVLLYLAPKLSAKGKLSFPLKPVQALHPNGISSAEKALWTVLLGITLILPLTSTLTVAISVSTAVTLAMALRLGAPGLAFSLPVAWLTAWLIHTAYPHAAAENAWPVRLLLVAFAALMLAALVQQALYWRRLCEGYAQQVDSVRRAAEVSPLGVTLIDMHKAGRPLVYCNPAFLRISGYSAHTILGRDFQFLRGEQGTSPQEREMLDAVARGTSCQVVLQNRRQDGSAFWNEVTLIPVPGPKGPTHYAAIQRDVTPRIELAAEVEQQRHELLLKQRLFEQVEDIEALGSWVLDLQSRELSWSVGSFRIMGRDPALGTPLVDDVIALFSEESQRAIRERLQAIEEGATTFDTVSRFNQRWMRMRGVVMEDSDQHKRLYGVIHDITERQETASKLRERDQRLHLFFESPLVGMAMLDTQMRWLEVNSRLCEMLGLSQCELMSSDWNALSVEEDLLLERDQREAMALGTSQGFETEKRFIRADGQLVHTRMSLQIAREGLNGEDVYLLLLEDTSARYQAEARYRTLVDNAPEAIVLFYISGRIVDCNENALRLFGYERFQLQNQSILKISPERQPDGQLSIRVSSSYMRRVIAGQTPVFEWTHLNSRGEEVPCEVRLVMMPDERKLVRASILNISERKRYQQEIERLAFTDDLTGLLNRRLLVDRLVHAMERERRTQCFGALLFMDLDHFKTINDSLGHHIGDDLLREVARRLQATIRHEDTLARIGGDEFVVLLEMVASNEEAAVEQAMRIGHKLLAALEAPCVIDGHELVIRSSIGIAPHPLPGQNAHDVMKQADMALYRAKHAGRNTLACYAPEMQAAINQRMRLQGQLRQAIERGQLKLMFQPQVQLSDNKVVGAEVLVRWEHPEQGLISPGQFIPLAEESDLIEAVGDYVLDATCATLARLQERWPELVLAVNLSPRELRQRDYVSRFEQCLARYGVSANQLELEITEGAWLEEVDSCVANMRRLKKQGVRFAIDDFGTGYSSLAYLSSLPLDRLKIDRSFVNDLQTKPPGRTLVKGIISIAHNLGLECIAEGVEQTSQVQMLLSKSCDLGQGYLFGKPMPEAAFVDWLEGCEVA